MRRFPLPMTPSGALLCVLAIALGPPVWRSLAMLRNVSQIRRGASSCDARPLTHSERASMERATADLNAEIDAFVADRPLRFPSVRRRIDRRTLAALDG